MKKTLSLVSLLAITAFSSIYSAEENPFMDWMRDRAIGMVEGAGDLAKAGIQQFKDMRAAKAAEVAANIADLERIVTNSAIHSPEKVAAAVKQLAVLQEEENKNRQFEQNLENRGIDLFVKAHEGGLEIAQEAILGQVRGAQKLKELAVQGGIAKQQAIAEAQIAADADRAKWQDRLNFLKDKKNMVTLGVGAALVAGGYYGAKHGSELLADAIRHYYRNPSLAQETSLPTFEEWLSEKIHGRKVLSASIKDVILEKTLEERIAVVAHSVQEAASTGNYLQNVLFYGPPGTGKTMIAQRIARSSGMHYIYFAASALEQFTIEEALIKLTELFEFAKKSDQKLMIIIDEAENLFADRTKGLPEKTAKMLTHLLTYTGTESRDYMVVLLTNLPSLLDSAVLSRMDQQIEIAPPALEQRIGILNKYISDLLIENKAEEIELSWVGKVGSWFTSAPKAANPIKIEKDALSQEVVASIAARLDGFVGRDISKLVLGLQARVNASKDKVVTPAMIKTVVAEKIAQHKAIKEGFKKA